MNNKCDYELIPQQETFVRIAEMAGLNVYYSYSGRGMLGRKCPAVNVSYLGEMPDYVAFSRDNMGKGYVVYCP